MRRANCVCTLSNVPPYRYLFSYPADVRLEDILQVNGIVDKYVDTCSTSETIRVLTNKKSLCCILFANNANVSEEWTLTIYSGVGVVQDVFRIFTRNQVSHVFCYQDTEKPIHSIGWKMAISTGSISTYAGDDAQKYCAMHIQV